AGRVHEEPDVVEEVAHRAVGAQVPAELRERVAYVGGRAVAVVRHAVDDHGRAARAVALVADFLVIRAVALTCTAPDGTVDVVLGHALRLGLLDGKAQPRVGADVAPAHARGHRDLADELGEQLAAFLVLGTLAVLDVCPLAVSGHGGLSSWSSLGWRPGGGSGLARRMITVIGFSHYRRTDR